MNIKSELFPALRCPICQKMCRKAAGSPWLTEEEFKSRHADDERVAKGDIEIESVHCQECAIEHPSSDEVYDDGDDATDTGNGGRTRDR